MKKTISKIVAAVLLLGICFGAFGVKSYAYSEIPEYFDFGDCVVNMDAGSTREMWIRSTYKYACYVGTHSSSGTYVECSEKAGQENIKIHVGADETESTVLLYFYVRDNAVKCDDIHDYIQVNVKNIDYGYAQRKAQAESLKWYANNNSEFNAYYYYMNYEDLRNAYGLDADALFNHYNSLGRAERRVANKLITK